MHEQRQTLIADFAIRGRLAYLSHQETMTLFQRALLRAGVPIAFSGGFNPRPRLSIPLPRSVGVQSEAERLCAVLETDEPVNAAAVCRRLADRMPPGCAILNVQLADGKKTFHPNRVQYQFTLSERLTASRRAHLTDCQQAIENGSAINVQRWDAKKKTHRPLDIARFLQRLDFSEADIDITCRVSQDGSVRVDEIMQWLQVDISELKEPVRRTAVQWNNP